MLTFTCSSTGIQYQVRLIDERTGTYEAWIKHYGGTEVFNFTVGGLPHDARFTAIDRLNLGDMMRRSQ